MNLWMIDWWSLVPVGVVGGCVLRFCLGLWLPLHAKTNASILIYLIQFTTHILV